MPGQPRPRRLGGIADSRQERKELSGAEAATTNNRMELMAAIEGLKALKRRCSVKLYTDSKYVLQGATEWLPNWKARGWRTAAREPVKNQDLWERLDAAPRRRRISNGIGSRDIRAMTATNTSISSPISRSIDAWRVARELMRQVVLDTETTGLEVEQEHRVIEIGCVELVNRRSPAACSTAI
jgi:hypothetical protein